MSQIADKHETEKTRKPLHWSYWFGLCLAIGVGGVGTPLILVLHNPAFGLAIGAALGMALFPVFMQLDRLRKR